MTEERSEAGSTWFPWVRVECYNPACRSSVQSHGSGRFPAEYRWSRPHVSQVRDRWVPQSDVSSCRCS